MKYTITAFTENKPGVLYRIADLFLRRKINIESLTVSETEQHGIARFTIVVELDKVTIEKLVKQLYRIVEVVKVFESTDKDLVFKELAFIKVSTKNPSERREVEELSYLFRARVTYVGEDYLVIEKSGSEDAITSLYLLLKPFGIKEFIRSGRIAVLREESERNGKAVATAKKPSVITSSIEVSAIKRLELMGRQVEGSVSLAQGIPSFETPKHIKKAAKDAIDKGLSDKYTAGYGIEELRVALAKKLKRDNNIAVDPSQVMVTHGGIEALMAVFISILNPGDEIIIITPDYASHITQTIIAHHGGKPVFVPLDEKNDWAFDPERLEGAITQNTKAVLICNPSNPIGKVYTEKELKSLADVAIRHNLYIITDEMYEYFTFDGTKHISIASFPEVADRTISVFGLSKSYAMTGWRIGYVVAGREMSKQIFKVHDSLVTCPTAVSQYAALAAIEGSQDCVGEFSQAFKKRRQIVVDELAKTDMISLVVPKGAYYAFPKIHSEIDDYELAVRLVKEAGVSTVPGSAFGLGGENHLRISFGCEEKQLKEGLRRLVQFLEKLKAS